MFYPFCAQEFIMKTVAPMLEQLVYVFKGKTTITTSTVDSSMIQRSDAAAAYIERGPIIPRDPLRFEFSGVSIWLDIEGSEKGGDYHRAINDCASKLGLMPIQGHVTAIYGITHLTEDEARLKFCGDVRTHFLGRGWPHLQPIGVLSDVELDGVNGGRMDMRWSEITLSSSDEHEACLDVLHKIFHKGSTSDQERRRPWRPHASIAYDNPEDSPLGLLETVEIISRYPSLTKNAKRVTGMSLWSTEGRISEWRCIERFEF